MATPVREASGARQLEGLGDRLRITLGVRGAPNRQAAQADMAIAPLAPPVVRVPAAIRVAPMSQAVEAETAYTAAAAVVAASPIPAIPVVVAEAEAITQVAAARVTSCQIQARDRPRGIPATPPG